MLFLHATSGGLLLTVAFFLRRFLAFYCFKCDLASFSRYKTTFLSHIMPPKQVEQAWDQIDAKWIGKKLVFWRKSQRVCRSLIIVNKSIKEPKNKKMIFFGVRSDFISLMNTKTCIFTRGYCVWCSFGEIKFDLTLTTSNILYFFLILSIIDVFLMFYDFLSVNQLSKVLTKFHCKNACATSAQGSMLIMVDPTQLK